ncbi:MAG TPA: hypothetical protein VMZ91_11570, partial [Candidatus Paceibacterota bacterium]|nr:hypothetical protein [Candidatus Paceibacterota bacterium]
MKLNGKKLKRFISKTKPKIKMVYAKSKDSYIKSKPKSKKLRKRARVIGSNINYYFEESQSQLKSLGPQNNKIRF